MRLGSAGRNKFREVRDEASWVVWGMAGGPLMPCYKQGRQSSDLARESKLEISLVKERSSAVVIIASELSLRETGLLGREYLRKYSLLF